MSKVRGLIEQYLQASRESKRSIVTLLFEMMRLRFSIGRIGVSEYLDFQLYSDDITFGEKCAFGGYKMQAVLEKFWIDDYSSFMSIDKITMYSLLEGYRLPIPKLRAVYRSSRPALLVHLDSPYDLGTYLKTAELSSCLYKTFERFLWTKEYAYSGIKRHVRQAYSFLEMEPLLLYKISANR